MFFQFSKKYLGLVLFLFISVPVVFAQETPYGALGLRKIYQSTLINPVLIPDSTAVENSLSFLPFVPASPFDMGVSVEVGALKLGTVTSSIQNGTLDINTLVNGMQNSKYSDMFVGANVSLMHAYFKVGKKGQRLEISQRFKTSIGTNLINKRTFDVFFGENGNNTTLIDLTDTQMRTMAWNEVALGYTTNVGKKWAIGGKFKYLTGVAYADFHSTKFVATLTPDGNSVDIDSQIRTASLNPMASSVNGQDMTPYNYDMQTMLMSSLTKNVGFAADFGVGYKLSNTVRAFAGFNDLGYITWKNNPLIYRDKAVIDDFQPIKYNSDTEKYEMDLSQLTDNAKVKASAFKTSLNTHMNIGTTWKPVKWFHSTLMGDAYFVDGGLAYPGGTLAGTLNGGRFSEFTMNVGYNQNRPMRVGAGMSMKLFVLQMHIFSNNILGAFNASRLQSADVQFGLSWAWRHKDKKNGYVSKKNKFSDKDNDGVADKEDACIDVAGPIENKGCPWKDTDGDMVFDNEDVCIDVVGPVENKGCPLKDTDGDMVLDKDDACADVAGPIENKGCPWKDIDGDKVLDKDDACIDVAGPVENKGCPWKDTDGDTVLDKDDDCVEIAGAVDNKGCPWKDTDGDTVIDKEDLCIDIPGTVVNKGCPEQVTKALVKALEVQAKSIFFNTGKATFKLGDNETFGSLDTIKEILVNYPNAKFSIEGHTDNVGSAKKNQILSKQRAEAVRKALIARGVSPSNLVAKGYGPTKPIASNKTATGREQNRRTVIQHIGSI